MLNIWIDENDTDVKYVHSAGFIFDAEYEQEWLAEDNIKAMIKDVDQSEYLGGELIMSPILGAIPPRDLSGGVKTLIMASHDDTRMYNLTSCGDNCAKWIIKLAENKDITMRLGHIMNFENVPNFAIKFLDTNKIIRSYKEYVSEYIDISTAKRNRGVLNEG